MCKFTQKCDPSFSENAKEKTKAGNFQWKEKNPKNSHSRNRTVGLFSIIKKLSLVHWDQKKQRGHP